MEREEFLRKMFRAIDDYREEQKAREGEWYLEKWLLEDGKMGDIHAKSKGHIIFIEDYEYFFALGNSHYILRAKRLEPIGENGQRVMRQYTMGLPFCDLTDILMDSDEKFCYYWDIVIDCPRELRDFIMTNPRTIQKARLEVCRGEEEDKIFEVLYPAYAYKYRQNHPDEEADLGL